MQNIEKILLRFLKKDPKTQSSVMMKDKIKFSCADFTFPMLSHGKALKLIKLLDFDFVDFGIFEGRTELCPSRIEIDAIREGKQLRNKLDELQLNPSDVFFQTGSDPATSAVNDPNEVIRLINRRWFLEVVKFAQILGCRHVTGLPGVYHDGISREKDWLLACQETMWRMKKAEAMGLVYAVEAHVGSILSDTEAALKFLTDCSGLSLTLDYGHFIYQGETNASVHQLIPYASHFHARGGDNGKLQTIVEENMIDYPTIMRKLKQVNYSGFICMEYVYQNWEGCNKTDNISETLKLRNGLQEFL